MPNSETAHSRDEKLSPGDDLAALQAEVKHLRAKVQHYEKERRFVLRGLGALGGLGTFFVLGPRLLTACRDYLGS